MTSSLAKPEAEAKGEGPPSHLFQAATGVQRHYLQQAEEAAAVFHYRQQPEEANLEAATGAAQHHLILEAATEEGQHLLRPKAVEVPDSVPAEMEVEAQEEVAVALLLQVAVEERHLQQQQAEEHLLAAECLAGGCSRLLSSL